MNPGDEKSFKFLCNTEVARTRLVSIETSLVLLFNFDCHFKVDVCPYAIFPGESWEFIVHLNSKITFGFFKDFFLTIFHIKEH